jgi:hypothetical protein
MKYFKTNLFSVILLAVTIIAVAATVYVYAVRHPTGSPIETGQAPAADEVVLRGAIDCLPAKETADGVIDMSCAIGMKAIDGSYFSLRELTPEDGSTPIGTSVQVKGIYTPATADEMFKTTGTIDVRTFTIL